MQKKNPSEKIQTTFDRLAQSVGHLSLLIDPSPPLWPRWSCCLRPLFPLSLPLLSCSGQLPLEQKRGGCCRPLGLGVHLPLLAVFLGPKNDNTN